MGNKAQPVGLRLGISMPWSSRWFDPRHFRQYLKEDIVIREFLTKRLKEADVEAIIIERSGKKTTVTIHTARPGLIIGRGGGGAEEIRKLIMEQIKKIGGLSASGARDLRLEIQEVRHGESSAAIVAQQVAGQLEKRQPFRRVLKRTLEKVSQDSQVRGVKIAVAGRLGGSEMSRREWMASGRLPLHTLRAHIDYAQVHAYTTWGAIGVKVWIYKGEVFREKEKSEDARK
ncbi:MAG: 30S ribosomal protein S3 [Candidatus Terrybacteria bacterium RIFCSPLOWO2_01_FULL_44_24]|uniref:Small ribosomal subunit protein uS3 n=1 Tax=Candidatus Terrybacteria bacterium RIFCSPHIGHO2_01_FULL_43_35 TaxID=1802361 RepID=A0A1G2PCZ5_9BACT|nr:MAG: 30S ribosomal protein S3 [Candidatus Terrybacteria bacterium RIFCSPHIGHO2_01_FULL_43_35]OHA49428.1 MAG: 30S ribosomal protein S3 [Candidatus Terrybacteria bacterium RIFCSPHIGHO2_02_FULL_43_14]OHA51655.1 MAG: 30S ribosomal protein S3 [Candidatus Terrybacteria bacterium RIFCSPLOWO2_01_FULL_44_24]